MAKSISSTPTSSTSTTSAAPAQTAASQAPQAPPPNVSDKNTKSEILDAYKKLLSQLKDKPAEDGPAARNAQEKKTAVAMAEKETVEKIINDLAGLKLSTSQTIATLTEKLTEEAERLATLRKAVAFSQQELEDTQKVKVTADQLFSLIELQKQQEESFAREMTAKREAWAEEQTAYEQQLKTTRTREEEEYAYAKKLARQRDTDQWEEEKRRQAKQKQEAEAEAEAITKELTELRAAVAGFEAEKQLAVKAAVDAAVNEIKKDAEVQKTFAKQEAESKLRLAEARITALEEKVAAQAGEVKELRRQAEDAVKNVKEIAVSFVEGAKKESAPVASKDEH